MATLDDVIKGCKENCGLDVTEINKPKYMEFLERQQKKHEYELEDINEGNKNTIYPYFDFLVDKLYLFAVVIMEQKVQHMQDFVIINTEKRLPLARGRGSQSHSWDDTVLYCINMRRASHIKRAPNLMRYVKIMEELCQDKEVVNVWGRELDYKKDFTLKKSRAG